MPNGVDKNLVRLAIASAEYRRRHGEWPTEARVAPLVLWEYGYLLDLPNFERLCSRLRLRTTDGAHLAVGGEKGHLVYEKLDESPTNDLVEEAWDWLGVSIKPGLHDD